MFTGKGKISVVHTHKHCLFTSFSLIYRYSEELRKKLQVGKTMLYNYIKRIKAGEPPRKGKSGGQWRVQPEVEQILADATKSHLVTNFDALTDECARLESIKKGIVHKQECKRTSRR